MVASALELTGISKSFAGARALSHVDLTVAPGEIHGLLGRNGSGKSTLIKILAGFHAPDPGGRLAINGREVPLPVHAGRPGSLGLSFVHQDLGLVPKLSIVENMRVGRYTVGRAGRVRARPERANVERMLARFGVTVGGDAPVSSLRPVDRALVAIARAFGDATAQQGGVVILDEPTAYLPVDGVERLFRAVREVAAAGTAVIIVTHRMEEVYQLTERVSVLRDGVMVASAETRSISEQDLIEHILGRRQEEELPIQRVAQHERALQVRDLSGGTVQGLSFEAYRGEVLGLAGLVGMGQAEVPYLLFGAEKSLGGTFAVGDEEFEAAALTPQRAIAAGIALLPAGRLTQSGVGGLPVRDNVSLPVVRDFFRKGRRDGGLEDSVVKGVLSRFNVVPALPQLPLQTLSGGNQQKALLGKWMQKQPPVLLLDEPSQGVDVGARTEIFTRLREAAATGRCVIMASSEFGDLARVCDRVLVFRYGRVAAELAGSDVTEDKIVRAAYRS
jgi:ribose transport system ATP-binding protein